MSFSEIIDSIETLELEEQSEIVRIVNSRLIEKKREEIYNNWQKSKEEYKNKEIVSAPFEEAILNLD
jgi:hypothetical protein